MQEIFESLPVYMMIGIVVVIGISQVNRLAGAVLSVVFWGAVAVVGNAGYERGHAVGLPGIEFPRWVFFLICGFFALTHVYAAFAHIRHKRLREQHRRMLQERD